MEFLDTSHNAALVFASLAVAIVAGFTGLTLTKDLSQQTLAQKKLTVAMAAFALGGGIWSMHFVAMLGLQMPILFYYDAAVTLASALIAILIVGVALILLHFTERSPTIVVAAGALVGIGIVAMHYIGMAGLELCRAVYTPGGIALALVAALGLSIAAFWVAYGTRTHRSILLGTLCFGVSVFAVHFVAIAGTRFVAVPSFSELGPIMSNEVLAIAVILSSFMIFGAFLWVGVTFVTTPASVADEPVAPLPEAPPTPVPDAPVRIPCERDGGKVFIAAGDVALIRADGHYTQVYTDEDRLFCVWSITEAMKRLASTGHLQVHRSYIVNPAKVAAFERDKDKGRCTFASAKLPKVPVSRSKLKAVQTALGA